MRVPYRIIGDEQAYSLTHFKASPWWAWARNAVHMACERGRQVVGCTGIAVDLGVGGGAGSEKTIDVPVYATPHERWYLCQVEYAVQPPALYLGATAEHWLSSEDRSGGTHLLEDAGRTRTLLRRDERPADYVPPLPYQDLEGTMRVLSGWHLHEPDPDLSSDRIIRIHADAGLQDAWLVGACVVGFSDGDTLWP